MGWVRFCRALQPVVGSLDFILGVMGSWVVHTFNWVPHQGKGLHFGSIPWLEPWISLGKNALGQPIPHLLCETHR